MTIANKESMPAGDEFEEIDRAAGGLGQLLVAALFGFLCAVAALASGAAWWSALAIYTVVGSTVLVLLAVRPWFTSRVMLVRAAIWP